MLSQRLGSRGLGKGCLWAAIGKPYRRMSTAIAADESLDCAVLTEQVLRRLIPQVLAAMPYEWRGTTFDNSNLLGREVFSKRLQALLISKVDSGAKPGEF